MKLYTVLVAFLCALLGVSLGLGTGGEPKEKVTGKDAHGIGFEQIERLADAPTEETHRSTGMPTPISREWQDSSDHLRATQATKMPASAGPTPAPGKSQISLELGRYAGGAEEWILPSLIVDAISKAQVGDKMLLPKAAADSSDVVAVVFMAERLDMDCWLRALLLEGFNDAVLTVALEPDGQLKAQVFSSSSAMAWKQAGIATGGGLLMVKVPRQSILPDCAGPMTEKRPASNSSVGSHKVAEEVTVEASATAPGATNGGVGSPPPSLESLPGSQNVLYLDFDGETVSGTQWNAYFTAGAAINAENPAMTGAEMVAMWLEISEDFRTFLVNVTTTRSIYEAANVSRRMKVVFTPTKDWLGRPAGGVAFMHTFGSSSSPLCWVFTNSVGNLTKAGHVASHELGHTLGLNHDGATAQEYYPGHGPVGGSTSWGPIMGASYYRRLVHWNPGDYPGANNLEDDIATIASMLGVRPDEDNNTQSSARSLKAPLGSTPNSDALMGDGIIGSRTDADWFYFDALVSGQVLLTCQPFTAVSTGEGVNVDAELQILNSSGLVLATSNPVETTEAQITLQLSPGRYYVRVDGVGKNSTDGYTDYGSAGCYRVFGNFIFRRSPEILRQPLSSSVYVGQSLFVLDVFAAGAPPLFYQWQRRTSASAPWVNVGTDSSALSLQPVQTTDGGQYRVTVNNAVGPAAVSEIATLTVNASPFGAQQYDWVNLAGMPGGIGNADGVGPDVGFYQPSGVAIDIGGNAYVADSGNHTIRKITPSGIVSVLAGSAGNPGTMNGTGSAARFYFPAGLAVDAFGNLFVADSGNHMIRKVSPAGVVSTVAGIAGIPGSVDGSGGAARFSRPVGLALDGGGNLYVADKDNHTIRKVSSTGAVTTLAGSPGLPGNVDGIGENARFNEPTAIAVGTGASLLVADRLNDRIRRITVSAVVSTLPGVFNRPSGVGVDTLANTYVSDNSHTIQIIQPNGDTVTLAGTPGIQGNSDGMGGAARFSWPSGIAVEPGGTLFIADTENHTIRRMTPTGIVTTLAGKGANYGSVDGTGSAARFNGLYGVAADKEGSVLAIERWNNTVRKVTSSGVTSTLAGSAGNTGSANGVGGAARFDRPYGGIAVHFGGNVIVGDTENHTIRRMTTSGLVTTLAGSPGSSGSADGLGNAARFFRPAGVAIDAQGTVFVADKYNHTIRKITTDGVVSTLAGATGLPGSNDGGGNAARFNYPHGIAIDSLGTIFVADDHNHTIRKVTSAGVVSTVAGAAGVQGGADGIGGTARFNNPLGVAVDLVGNVYVADTDNHTVRKITSGGTVTTIGGQGGHSGRRSGVGSVARLSSPSGISVTATGIVYVADTGNNRLLRGSPLVSGAKGALVSEATDSDGDGQSDVAENLAGTDPNNADSVLSVLQVSGMETPIGGLVEVSWPAVDGRIYRVEYSSTLGDDWVVLQDFITATNGISILTATVSLPAGPRGFIRVVVRY